MRIAVLIQCHKNPKQINLLLERLNHPDIDCYLHIDKKADFADKIIHRENVFVLPDEQRVSVEWAQISQVTATLNLLNTAVTGIRGGYDYYWLISGQDWPLRSADEIVKFFEKHSYDALSMEEVLRNPILFAQDVIVPSGRWGLDIIPSNMNLVAAADDLITDKDGDQMGRIRHVLNQVEEDYDYCIIDCHPGVGIEVLNALAAAEDIIIPIKADKNALDGMEELDDIIQEIRPYNEKLESVRCLVTMYTKDIDVIKGEEALRNSKYDVFNTHIRHSKKVTAWTYENGQSLLETTPRSAATRDYKNLVLEYMGKRG